VECSSSAEPYRLSALYTCAWGRDGRGCHCCAVCASGHHHQHHHQHHHLVSIIVIIPQPFDSGGGGSGGRLSSAHLSLLHPPITISRRFDGRRKGGVDATGGTRVYWMMRGEMSLCTQHYCTGRREVACVSMRHTRQIVGGRGQDLAIA